MPRKKLTPEEIGQLYWGLSPEDRKIAFEAASEAREIGGQEAERERKKYVSRDRLEKLRALGRCLRCGKRKPYLKRSKVRCKSCLEADNAAFRRRWHQN